jgi:predicted nuclease with TOPRIM domain
MNEIDEQKKVRVLDLHLQGLSNRDIGKQLSISHPTVGKVLDEIASGKADYIPGDIVSDLELIREGFKFMKREGIGVEELSPTTVLHKETKNLGLDNIILLDTAKLYKENMADFPSILGASKFIVQKEKEEGFSAREVEKHVESLFKKKKSLESDAESLLIEIGRRKQEIDGLNSELKKMKDEVSFLEYAREKIGRRYSLARKIADIASSFEGSEGETEGFLMTVINLIESGLDPRVVIERGEELDFLRSFWINKKDIGRTVGNLKPYPSLESFVSSFMSFAANRDKLIRDAEAASEEAARLKIRTFGAEIDDLNERRDELRRDVEGLIGIKEDLEDKVSNIRRTRDSLSMENVRNTLKLKMLFQNLNEGKIDGIEPMRYIYSYILEGLELPTPIPLESKEVYLSADVGEAKGEARAPKYITGKIFIRDSSATKPGKQVQ